MNEYMTKVDELASIQNIVARTKMKGEPLEHYPTIAKLEKEVSERLEKEFNIGVDLLCYRNGNDHIGFHADDTQGETFVFCLTVESKQQRRLIIKPAKSSELEIGDEKIELFPTAGDGYDMTGDMQRNYVHSIRKEREGTNVAKRFALVFRKGRSVDVKRDDGDAVKNLQGTKKAKIRYLFGKINGIEEGQVYLRRELLAKRAHQ